MAWQKQWATSVSRAYQAVHSAITMLWRSQSRRPFVCCLRFEDFLGREMAVFEIVNNRTNASIDQLREYRAALITAAVAGQIDMSEPKMSGMMS